jgi:hypothetical protein
LVATWKKLLTEDDFGGLATQTPASITEGAPRSVGTSTKAAKEDHAHPSPASWTPSTHATSHKSGSSDSLKLNELAAPTAAVNVNKQQLTR